MTDYTLHCFAESGNASKAAPMPQPVGCDWQPESGVILHHLAKQDWLASNRLTIANISAGGYLFWPDHADLDWLQFPSINAWLKRIQSLENRAAPEDIIPSGPQSA